MQKYDVVYNFSLLKKLVNDVPPYDKDKDRHPPLDKEVREKVLERDNHRCVLCGIEWNICHHIHPQGSSEEDNLVILCYDCHTVVHILLTKKGYRFYYRTGWDNIR